MDRVLYLPTQIQRMIQSDIYKLVRDSRVYCFECDSFVDVDRTKMDEHQSSNTLGWTDVWICSSGHSLYFEQHEAIFCK